MQKYIEVLLIAALLSGCTPRLQASGGDPSQKKAIEEASWTTLQKLSPDKCGAGPSPPEREDAVELSNCVTGLVYEYVLPNAVSPSLLMQSREEALRMAQDYADGKMSPAEYRLRSEARLKAYSNSMFRSVSQQGSPDMG